MREGAKTASRVRVRLASISEKRRRLALRQGSLRKNMSGVNEHFISELSVQPMLGFR